MNARKYGLLIGVQMLAAVGLYGQMTRQVSHYMLNPQMYNPASAGFTNAVVASGIHRQRWYGFENAPQTTLLSVDAPIKMISSGVGLNVMNDRIGNFNNTAIGLIYNYQLPVFQGVLGIGAQGGLNSMGMQITDPKAPSSDRDGTIEGREDVSKFLFDASFGLFYQVPDRYEIGISLEHINEAHSPDLAYRQKRTLNLSGNYHFTLDAFPEVDFVPSARISTEFTSMDVDLSLLGFYNQQYWGGITSRLGESIVLLGGLFIKQFLIGLSYDMTTNWMFKSSTIGGGFELFARFNFNLSVDRLPKSYKNSRYL